MGMATALGATAGRKAEASPIHGANYTNPNCTCGGAPCLQSKSPTDQMALLDATDPALGALRVLAEGDKQPGELIKRNVGPTPEHRVKHKRRKKDRLKEMVCVWSL